MSIDVKQANSYEVETDWSSMMGTPIESLQKETISSTLPVIGDETVSEREVSQDLYDPVFSWTSSPRTDMTSPYIDSNQQQPPHQRPKTLMDPTMQHSLVSWYEQPESHYSTSGPGLYGSHNVHMTNTQRSATCNCFNTCLAALQALHNSDTITSTSPFDVILTINQRAVETCSTMLNCPICTSKSGSSLQTMLLGTILGRIIAIYQDASKNYFALTSRHGGGPIQQLPLTFGTYRVANEDVRWLQMEIILRDLKKLKELFAKFQETSMMSESEEDAGMHGAVSNYLCQSLDLTFESLRKQRSFTGGQL